MTEKDSNLSLKLNKATITEARYIKERLEDQIKWLSANSAKNKNYYKRMRSLVILLSVLLPFLVGLVTDELWYLKLAVGLMGVLIAALEGLLALNKYQEKWQGYRTASEALEREKYTYLAKTGPYSGADPFKALVNNVEAILAKESEEWKKYIHEEKKVKRSQ